MSKVNPKNELLVSGGDSKTNEQANSSLNMTIDEENFKYSDEVYGEFQYSPYIGVGSWASSQRSEEFEEDVVEKSLSYLEISAVTVVLEDAVDELSILKYVIGAPVLPPPSNIYLSPKQRFMKKLTPGRRHPELDNLPALTTSLKVQRDREQIKQLFVNLMKELKDSGSYSCLVNMVLDMKMLAEDETVLIVQAEKNLVTVKQLQAAVANKRRLDDLEEKGREEFVYQLQDELDDVKLKCEVERNFVDKWENVRKAQNLMRLKNVENEYTKEINDYNVKLKMEKRVTSEFQQFLKMKQSELEEQLESWMALYDSEMERRESRLLHLKYDRDQTAEKKVNLQILVDERKREMEEWIKFRDLRKKRSLATLKIQNWWRGMMVRKKLGPYKPKKQKKGKKEIK